MFKCLAGVVTNLIMSKYEANPFNNNKVTANNIKFQAHNTVIDQFRDHNSELNSLT